MNIEDAWNKALSHTEIIRARVQGLMTFQDTHVPYIMLSESEVNHGDTVVRKGEVVVQRPSLILPPHAPQFDGFEFDQEKSFDQNSMINFLLVRGISLPSLRYNNTTDSMDVYEGKLSAAIKHYQELLEHQENVNAGLLTGPQDCWQFSVLIFICSQIIRNSDIDIKKLLDQHRKRLGHD